MHVTQDKWGNHGGLAMASHTKDETPDAGWITQRRNSLDGTPFPNLSSAFSLPSGDH
eukprot:CAMPEP_0174364290 /NCGR_PEP_ID=MMETSP0811_2-20130205/72263_1 /TAXON_ID=73025 ORGANISM="Eutreptiella gymnastica-like, Strain CCMP1594" /NCGR_SAMPLE_ID=MMETSP0811_2 /ASSEMBLY_ACC=CAM_ASM_000667 /LENGTH=56 /DNA_ID=CAMNT_0015503779 /DNA_START=95 /DNA_END=262 /DNA_ORIENTATION=-